MALLCVCAGEIIAEERPLPWVAQGSSTLKELLYTYTVHIAAGWGGLDFLDLIAKHCEYKQGLGQLLSFYPQLCAQLSCPEAAVGCSGVSLRSRP